MMMSAAATVSVRWALVTSPSKRAIWRTPETLYRALDAEIRFVRGRLNYTIGGECNRPAPFDSMVVVFHPFRIGEGHIRTQPTFPGFGR